MPVSRVPARVIVVLCLLSLLPTNAVAEGRTGLAGLFRASSKAPVTQVTDAVAGAAQASGTSSDTGGPIAKACGTRGKALGKVIEKGPGKWKLHDTNPGGTSVRDFYLTGFSDGCPRRVSGAVAMFGSIELYELVHYGPVGMKPGRSDTDAAYARMRSKFCAPSAACKERSVKKLAKQAVFVDVYASATGAGRLQLLMSRGKLAATARK